MVKVKVDLAEANYKYNSFNHPMVKVKVGNVNYTRTVCISFNHPMVKVKVA